MSTLLDVDAKLNAANWLVEAVYMAASSIGDRDATHAIQFVCEEAKTYINEALEMIETLRTEGKQ